mmetsp:Transcript_31989/g.79754  ORF Transcript_31989/g.79754 Transcript_31989/m.79754 type:complete len:321 (-) Transcript_31989:1605-2567(-)
MSSRSVTVPTARTRSVAPRSIPTAMASGSSPKSARLPATILAPTEMVMLARTTRRVLCAWRTACGRRSKFSSSNTIEAASHASAVPDPPMATPTSASARASASLIPSPSIATGPRARRSRTQAPFCAGSRPACQSTSASCLAMGLAVVAEAPVSIVVSMPNCMSRATASAASGRATSLSAIARAGAPSTTTTSVASPKWASLKRANHSAAAGAQPAHSNAFSLPTHTQQSPAPSPVSSATSACTPTPSTALKCSALGSETPSATHPTACATTACAIGCVERASTAAARRSNCCTSAAAFARASAPAAPGCARATASAASV